MQAAGHSLKKSGRVCVCLCVRKGSGRTSQTWHEPQSTKPSRSFLSSALLPHQSNVHKRWRLPNNSCHPQFQPSCYPNAKISHANSQRANTPSTAIQQGRSLLPHLPQSGLAPRPGLPTGMRMCSPAGPSVLNRHGALKMLNVPHSITVPGPAPACPPCSMPLSLLQSHMHRGTEHEGPGNLSDGWTRFLSHQQGRWRG